VGDGCGALEGLGLIMNWTERRVFVTGATGIVGSCLMARLIEEGAHVVALVRDWDPQSDLIRSGTIARANVVSGRLEDYATIERAINEHAVDTVFHLGAQPIVTTALRNPLPTFEANIRGSYNLLEACRVHRDLVAQVVVASSDKAYGDGASLPYTEDMPLNGRHPYDVSKSCTDLIAASYAHTYELPVVIARCGNIFGGGDLNWDRIVPGTIRSLLRGERPVVRSDGSYTRDYIYVQDVVDGYLALAEHCVRPEVRGFGFNFSLEHPVTVLEIVSALQRLMDRPDLAPVVQNRAQREIRDQYLDSTRARQILGWSARHTFEEGLRETIAWYERYLSADVHAAAAQPC
jgi:CDP-glucose 4,6-dehydratase